MLLDNGGHMLKVTELTKSFGSGTNKLDVLKGIEMEIERGEMVALMALL